MKTKPYRRRWASPLSRFALFWIGSFWIGSLFVAVSQASAQSPVPLGLDFLVNTFTTDRQNYPAIAADSNGNFLVVWESDGSPAGDNSSDSIQGRQLTLDGGAEGPQFQINTYVTGRQGFPAVAGSGDGDFLVVWESNGSLGDDTSAASIQGQRVAADGSPLGSQFQVNHYTEGSQRIPAVAMTPTGEFVVVWQGYDELGDLSYTSVQGQRFAADATPLGSQFQVNTYTTGWQAQAAVEIGADGNFVVVWTSVCCTDYNFIWSIQGQRFAADATPLGAEFRVDTYTTGVQWSPAVGMDSKGNFVVVWGSDSSPSDDPSRSVQGQRFAADATAVGSQFQVNIYTSDGQDAPRVEVSPAGDFIVVWDSFGSSGDDTALHSIQGRRFAADATPLGSEFQVNSYSTDHQVAPALALAPNGDFVAAWYSQNVKGDDELPGSIRARRFQVPIFADGFESGDTTAWSNTVAAN